VSTKLSREIINAAIQGFEVQKQRVDAQIAELCAMLNGGQLQPAAEPQTGKRHKMSAAGRKAIAETQRRRWATVQAESAPAKQVKTPERRLSAAGRKAIVDALKKRWAAKKAAEAKNTRAA